MVADAGGERILAAELRLLDGSGAVIPVGDWHIWEKRQGWSGFGVVNPGPGEDLTPVEAFERAAGYSLTPDTPAAMALVGKKATASATPGGGDFIRSWPSVVTKVSASVPAGEGSLDFGVCVMFSDPLSYLFRNPLWGVFKDLSPGEILSGALMLASGAESGEPTLRPVLQGLPPIAISQSLREGVSSVPYAIAAGEPLGWWLGALFGRLGVRMALLGGERGGIDLTLRDGDPAGAAVELALRTDNPGASAAVVSDFTLGAAMPERGALLDNVSIGQPVRFGADRPVGRLFTGARLDLDEAAKRFDLASGVADLQSSRLRVTTGQPGLHPGRAVRFDRPVTGARQWQVAEVRHGAAEGVYRNQSELEKPGAWVPPQPPRRGAAVVSGVVHDPDADTGAEVERDGMGRIPVRFGFSQRAIEETGAADAPPPEILLPVAPPMAGGTHGFVPSHRHGDVCRIAVNDPLSAEVLGFGFTDHRRLGDDFVDVTMGVLAEHGRGERWSGMVYRPGDIVEEEEKEQSRDWRAGKD